MKAIIKNTKEIVEVTCVNNYNSRGEIINSWYHSTDGRSFSKDELEFIDLGENLDYWTRLEHQTAIAAMGGLCGNTSYDETAWENMAEDAIRAAHALVEKIKEKEERK